MYKIDIEDLSVKAYKAIKELIIKNELKPGDRLRQEELAEKFGISRTPILSAISKLEKEMLIELSPRKGAFIKQYSNEELLNIYDIRLKLEPLGAREAAKYAKADDKKQLQDISNLFLKYLDSNNEGMLRETDYEFHMKIIEVSRNSILYNIISMFSIVMLSNYRGFMKDPHISHAEHSEVLKAILNNDEDCAEEVMLNHIRKARANLISKFFPEKE